LQLATWILDKNCVQTFCMAFAFKLGLQLKFTAFLP